MVAKTIRVRRNGKRKAQALVAAVVKPVQLEGSRTTALVILLPRGVGQRVDVVRTGEDTGCPRWPAHVNLRFPFATHAAFADVYARLQYVLRGFGPFDLAFDEHSLEQYVPAGSQTHVYFLKPKNDAKLQLLDAAIRRCLPELACRSAYHPTITLGQTSADLIEAKIKNVKEWLSYGFSFRVENICMLARDPLIFDSKFDLYSDFENASEFQYHSSLVSEEKNTVSSPKLQTQSHEYLHPQQEKNSSNPTIMASSKHGPQPKKGISQGSIIISSRKSSRTHSEASNSSNTSSNNPPEIPKRTKSSSTNSNSSAKTVAATTVTTSSTTRLRQEINTFGNLNPFKKTRNKKDGIEEEEGQQSIQNTGKLHRFGDTSPNTRKLPPTPTVQVEISESEKYNNGLLFQQRQGKVLPSRPRIATKTSSEDILSVKVRPPRNASLAHNKRDKALDHSNEVIRSYNSCGDGVTSYTDRLTDTESKNQIISSKSGNISPSISKTYDIAKNEYNANRIQVSESDTPKLEQQEIRDTTISLEKSDNEYAASTDTNPKIESNISNWDGSTISRSSSRSSRLLKSEISNLTRKLQDSQIQLIENTALIQEKDELILTLKKKLQKKENDDETAIVMKQKLLETEALIDSTAVTAAEQERKLKKRVEKLELKLKEQNEGMELLRREFEDASAKAESARLLLRRQLHEMTTEQEVKNRELNDAKSEISALKEAEMVIKTIWIELPAISGPNTPDSDINDKEQVSIDQFTPQKFRDKINNLANIHQKITEDFSTLSAAAKEAQVKLKAMEKSERKMAREIACLHESTVLTIEKYDVEIKQLKESNAAQLAATRDAHQHKLKSLETKLKDDFDARVKTNQEQAIAKTSALELQALRESEQARAEYENRNADEIASIELRYMGKQEKLANHIEKLEAEILQLQQRINEADVIAEKSLRKKIKKMERDFKDNCDSKIDDATNALREKLEKYKGKIKRLEDRVSELQTEISILTVDKENMVSNFERIKRDLERAEAVLLSCKSEHFCELERLQETIDDFEEQIRIVKNSK
ncbi:hypothetical protein HK100_001591 [Physocladia obscura]|uniref:Uncharacterized protein n=1 Tax=Physocladia obscura TaxID=109957 RepID=A0AAD5XGB8_9FUNG|nr:hypothetical protein HK100_001591 [Physocladia obscura]